MTRDELLVARLGQTEFFLEDAAGGTTLRGLAPSPGPCPPGVYPVLREDWGFVLGGGQAEDVLAQVCNVNFAALPLDSRPVIMTLMIGVAVLVVPQGARDGAGAPDAAAAQKAGARDARRGAAGGAAQLGTPDREYRIWCDPSFGPYLAEALGAVVVECGGRYTGVSG